MNEHIKGKKEKLYVKNVKIKYVSRSILGKYSIFKNELILLFNYSLSGENEYKNISIS